MEKSDIKDTIEYVDPLSGEKRSAEAAYAEAIGTMCDLVKKNLEKNLLLPLKKQEEGKTKRSALPGSYISIISHLCMAVNDVTVGELAKLLGVSNSNLTPVLNEMEAGGYIYRKISPSSRRCVNVFLTDKSLDIMIDFLYKMNPIWEDMLTKVLSRDELFDMFRTMCKLNYYLNRFDQENKLYYSASEEIYERGLSDEDFIFNPQDIDSIIPIMPPRYADYLQTAINNLKSQKSNE